MNKEIDRIKKVRLFLLEQIKDLTTEQLNEIPAGFNNNIIWNLGHLVAAQQGICYMRAGLATVTEEKYFLLYKTGTKPEQLVDSNEVEIIKELLLSTMDKLEVDYNNHLFSNYSPFTTRYGVELTNINEAISFLNFHEGLHSGNIGALKRILNNKI